jgi:hypothetical protein
MRDMGCARGSAPPPPQNTRRRQAGGGASACARTRRLGAGGPAAWSHRAARRGRGAQRPQRPGSPCPLPLARYSALSLLPRAFRLSNAHRTRCSLLRLRRLWEVDGERRQTTAALEGRAAGRQGVRNLSTAGATSARPRGRVPGSETPAPDWMPAAPHRFPLPHCSPPPRPCRSPAPTARRARARAPASASARPAGRARAAPSPSAARRAPGKTAACARSTQAGSARATAWPPSGTAQRPGLAPRAPSQSVSGGAGWEE